MSLLLDARKKAQQARSAQDGGSDHPSVELSLENLDLPLAKPNLQDSAASSDDLTLYNRARSAGKNLFNAKSSIASPRSGTINRNLLLALGGTLVLFAAGAGYVWYADSASNTQPTLPHSTPAISAQNEAAADSAKPQGIPLAKSTGSTSTDSVLSAQGKDNVPRQKLKTTRQPGPRISVKPQQSELAENHLAELVNSAYRAYRSGHLDEARQMYLEALGKDAHNTDVLLGLAAIAQQRGEDQFAAQYYLRVLTLDPRNPVANAGMSALTTDENSESRLKTLLREQRDSAALHFALGNLYASQSRWGEAQSAYFNAYLLDSKNAELALNLAVSLDHLSQYKLAAQYYQLALQLDQTGVNQPHGFDHLQISQRVKELTR